MSRHTYVKTERDLIAFAERAARRFAADSRLWSYSDGELAPGELLALRWGMGDDCVHVMRLGDDEPVIFGQLIKTVEPEAIIVEPMP